MAALLILALAQPARGSTGVCPLYGVQPPARAISVEFQGARLTRGSLVRSGCGVVCPSDHTPVQVVSVNPWYREPDEKLVEARAVGCLPTAVMVPVEGQRLLGLDAPAGRDLPGVLEPGTLTGAVGAPQSCSESQIRLGDESWSIGSLRHARPVTDEQIALLNRIGSVYRSLFGPIGLHRIGLSDWGYVALPMVHERTETEIEAAWERESLRTETQQEKTVVAEGPAASDGTAVYLHFLGTDARYSDRWARPETIEALLQLARGWFDYCTDEVVSSGQAPSPAVCTLQIGDLAWYNDRQPDPLGHRHHASGRCVDLRLFRSDASRYEAYWNRPDDREGFGAGYAPAVTGQFLRYAIDHAPVGTVFFNDADLHVKFPEVESRPGHDDHIHMCFDR